MEQGQLPLPAVSIRCQLTARNAPPQPKTRYETTYERTPPRSTSQLVVSAPSFMLTTRQLAKCCENCRQLISSIYLATVSAGRAFVNHWYEPANHSGSPF